MASLKEHKRAILTVDLPEHQLCAGDVGTIVHIYNNGAAYEVEFFTVDSKTFDVITVNAEQLRPVGSGEMVHARPLI